VASTDPVAGLTVSTVSPDWACVHSPPISIPFGLGPLMKSGAGTALTSIVCVTGSLLSSRRVKETPGARA
jgi:hypothetical protein